MNAKIRHSMFTAFLPQILGLGSEPVKKAVNILRFPLASRFWRVPGMYRFRFRFGFWCCRAFCFMSGGFRVQRLHFRFDLWCCSAPDSWLRLQHQFRMPSRVQASVSEPAELVCATCSWRLFLAWKFQLRAGGLQFGV